MHELGEFSFGDVHVGLSLQQLDVVVADLLRGNPKNFLFFFIVSVVVRLILPSPVVAW